MKLATDEKKTKLLGIKKAYIYIGITFEISDITHYYTLPTNE